MLLMMFVIFSCPMVFYHDLSRFLLIFVACLATLIGKGVALVSPFGVNYFPAEHNLPVRVVAAATITTMFLPGLLLAIACCWHRDIVKTVIAHPSVALMPSFTLFTFSSQIKCDNMTEDEDEDRRDSEQRKNEAKNKEPFIAFSAKFTLVNILLSMLCTALYGISMTGIGGWDSYSYHGLPSYLDTYMIIGFPIQILGVLLTLLSLQGLVPTSKTPTMCHFPPFNCCCNCCSLPRVEYSALSPSQPQSSSVLNDEIVPEKQEQL